MINPRKDRFTFMLDGGIGDILLCMDGIKELVDLYGADNLDCVLFSHFRDAPQLIDHFGFTIFFWHYENNAQFLQIHREKMPILEQNPKFLGHAKLYGEENDMHPRIYQPKFDQKYFTTFPAVPPAIAVHPFGSEFSRQWLTQEKKLPSKDMTKKFLRHLYDLFPLFNIYVIGAPGKEREWYDSFLLFNEGVKTIPVFENNIWAAFDAVDQCAGVIAADSAIKSYSAIRHIPTVVILGDYDDQIRDTKFIDPYIKDGSMSVVKFTDEPGEKQAKECAKKLMEKMAHA